MLTAAESVASRQGGGVDRLTRSDDALHIATRQIATEECSLGEVMGAADFDIARFGGAGLEGRSNMEMMQVRYFLALCHEHNFTRAAHRCGVAQPSLTAAIGKLERELGGRLFERRRSGTNLTPFGKKVARYFVAISRAVTAIEHEARPRRTVHADRAAQRRARRIVRGATAMLLGASPPG